MNSEDDELFLANLTHMKSSRADKKGDYHLGTICMHVNVLRTENLSKKVEAGLDYYWNTAFLFWGGKYVWYDAFQMSGETDKRISTLKSWENATKENPRFILEIPWIDTNLTVKDVLKSMIGSGTGDKIIKNGYKLADIFHAL